jgi:hypothetical protein
MGNKVIYISDNSEKPKKTGLEVYRDISILADLNQANIMKSYREVIPIAYLANDIYVGINLFHHVKQDNEDTLVAHSYLSDMFDGLSDIYTVENN